ncbi:DUF2815 family protein [uncultured Megasphaera sp.]|uniref:DUF2815 family protein n=1 Tax=uncultured Megasphaera sp. TaxID=165188 RepID=UPI0025CE9BDB|nr:DUF2815 family protein [uncultured Megasphaera sp.]
MENASVVLENVRLSYVHLLKPYARDPQATPKFQATILLPKTDAVGKQKLDAALAAATRNGINGKWNGAAPVKVPNPVWDGDGLNQSGNTFGPECKGCWVFAASSPADKPVDVVDGQLNRIMDATKVYSGMYANISVNFFPYNYQGKKGVGCGLGPVQKVRDGEPLGGSAPSAKSVFQPIQQAPATGAVNPLTGEIM